MFDSIGLHLSNIRIAPGAKSTFGPICVRKGLKTLQKTIGILSAVVLNRSKALAKDLRKLH